MSDVTNAPPVLHRGWLLVLLPAGFGFGVVAGFFQEHRAQLGGIAVPWASMLLVAALVITVRALSISMLTRVAGALFYAGWVIATALLALPNPSGDLVFTADLGSFSYLLIGGVLGAAAAGWPLFLGAADAEPQVGPDV